MAGRIRSVATAMGIGMATGTLILVAVYVQNPAAPAATRQPATNLTVPRSDPNSSPVGTLSPHRTSQSSSVRPAGAAKPRSDACPTDMVLVEGSYCPELPYVCARTLPDHMACAEYERGQRCAAPLRPMRYCIDRHEWPNVVGENPTVYVSWDEAKEQCLTVGKRLCARSEWTLACEGPKRLPYPWGFVRRPSPCNIDRHPIGFDANALADEQTRDEELERLWQADPIGSHADCISAYGAFDLVGNVDEWTDDAADDPHSAHPSTLNGGYWGPVRNTCRLTTTRHGPSFRFYQVGFRCCADAAPPTVGKLLEAVE